MAALPRTYDHLFERYRNRIPLNFMRALAKRESNLNPTLATGYAWGLMQVVPDVLESYNKRMGTNIPREDLLTPDTNVRIVADLLNRIVVAYSKHSDPNLRHGNWANPEFAKLVTAGWNSGYSEAAGVGHVASYLEAKGIPVTHNNVFKYAAVAGGTRHLSNVKKQEWQQRVVELYFAEGGPGLFDSGSGFFLKLALTVLASWGLYRLLR